MNCFKNIIENKDFFDGVDPECINEPADYIELIRNLCEITNGILVFNSCYAWEAEGKYLFAVTINNAEFNFGVEVYADTVDDGHLVEGMNEVLAKWGYEGDKRFCNITGAVLDFGIAFISPQKEQELATNGFIWKDSCL